VQFAAIDFETASGIQASACSIGIAVVDGGEIVARKEWLIRPPSMYFSPSNIEVHGITPVMVEDAPEFDALWPELEREIGGRTLVAHNASFDMGVLRATLAHYDVWCEKMQFVCSVALARKCWPELRGHSLGALAREFGIVFRHHNAEEDAVVAAQIVLRAAHECGADSMEQLMEHNRLRMGEVSPGTYVSCRSVPKKRRSVKLVYESDGAAS
jgi:DNA polymerase-3 subunit epsilon